MADVIGAAAAMVGNLRPPGDHGGVRRQPGELLFLRRRPVLRTPVQAKTPGQGGNDGKQDAEPAAEHPGIHGAPAKAGRVQAKLASFPRCAPFYHM